MLPIAVDAMGGDRAPGEIIAGAKLAAEELGAPIVLVGQPEVLGDCGMEVIPASEVIEMHDDPGSAVRTKKDSSLVVAAQAVRDGSASAMISAGNTGATMASALLRMGRISGVARPAVATPIPVPGATPTILLDAGANAECTPMFLVQFAQMGSVMASERLGIESPRVGLLSIGEEKSKGTMVVKETHEILAGMPELNFIGNVEGRDMLTDEVDVVVTDGFTGNVVLKTLEGAAKNLISAMMLAMQSTDESRAAMPAVSAAIGPFLKQIDPDSYGGAMLLGVDGVCIISHGSSSARAIKGAVEVAVDMVQAGLVDKLGASVKA